MSNPEWAILTDSEKGQLVSLWIVAADKQGEIPGDPRILRKICLLDEEPNINKFIDLGFMATTRQPDDDQITSGSHQSDAPETETETETDKHISGDSPPEIPKEKWIKPEGVDEQAWTDFEDHRKAIRSSMTDRARTLNAHVLEKHSPRTQRAIVANTIRNNWKGLFPPKDTKHETSGSEFDEKDYTDGATEGCFGPGETFAQGNNA